MSYCLEMDRLTLKKRKQTVLEECSVRFLGGQYYSVLGDNMADLLYFAEIFTGELEIAQGSLIFHGFEREDIYYIRRDNGLFDHMNIAENILIGRSFARRFKDRKNGRSQKKLIKIMQDTGLKLDLKMPVKELSIGEVKIIELLRGYHLNRKMLVLDNVYSLMDYEEREIFDRILTEILKKETIVVFLTNSVENAMRRSDEILIFYDKKIHEKITGDQMRKNPRAILKKLNRWENEEVSVGVLFGDTAKFLDQLSNTSQISTMTQEIEQILDEFVRFGHQYLNVGKIFIYINDYNNFHFISNLKDEDAEYKLKPSTVDRLMKKKQFLCESYRDNHFQEMFCRPIPYKTAIFQSFEIEASVKGLITFLYDDYYLYTQNDYIVIKSLTRELTMAIEKSRLLGKSALLQESHHRIKNNLQLIISALSLQKMFYNKTSQHSVDEVIDKVISQIKSIAVVHEFLSKNETDVNMVHAEDIAGKIAEIYAFGNVQICLDIDDIIFPYYVATNFAIVMNELINNSVKYAKTVNDNDLRIRVVCKEKGNMIYTEISDNGKGYPDSMIERKMSSGLGISLICSIVKDELKSEVKMENNHGAKTYFWVNKNKIL